MIPKTIHYCWFGRNPLPESAKQCIDSWRKFFPDWEIKEWNESNFDVRSIPYCAEAYDAKKYAFVSDYARYKILYEHGGVYFDTDVEVISSMDDIISRGNFFGFENIPASDNLRVAPGLGMGAVPGLEFYRLILELYATLHFRRANGSLNQTTIVTYTTDLLIKLGLKPLNEIQCIDDIYIYPKEYFSPIDYDTLKCEITPETRSIHHFAESWLSPQDKRKQDIKRKLYFLPDKVAWKLAKLFSMLRLP